MIFFVRGRISINQRTKYLHSNTALAEADSLAMHNEP